MFILIDSPPVARGAVWSHSCHLVAFVFICVRADIVEILSKVVYAERAHPVEMISKVSLGGLLDLFLTVDEFDARYDFGEQFRTVEPAPVFLGFQAQFKDHGQCRDS